MGTKKVCLYLATLLAGVALGAGMVGYPVYRAVGDLTSAGKFVYSLTVLRKHFVGTLDNDKLCRGAISGLMKATGDPYTVFLDEKDFDALEEMRIGSFGGIGVVFGKRGEDYVIISVLEDNPSAKVGVKAGEKIVAVDGKPTREMHMDEVAYAIRGEPGTVVEVTLQDKKKQERKVKITRALIKSPSVAGKLLERPGAKLGYIRIAQFNDNTGPDFRKELAKLAKSGMQGLILDLRFNPGGLLQQAVEIGRELVPAGPIVSTVLKNGAKYVEKSHLAQVRWPLVVLVNEGSASASEIVAGAVKDTKAGVLIGIKTFGKGCVQAVYPFAGTKTGLKVTIAKYYTPSGVCIDEVGIEPDVEVTLPEHSTTDVQLEAAEKYLEKIVSDK